MKLQAYQFTIYNALLHYGISFIGVFIPVYLFMNITLLVFGNVLSVEIMEITLVIMPYLILFFMSGFNIYLIYKQGETCASILMNLKSYDMQDTPVSHYVLLQREGYEKIIPLTIVYILFQGLGVLLYILFCIIFIIIDSHHRTWIDVFLHIQYQSDQPTLKSSKISIQL